MLALMLPCLGAWAQPQTSDTPADGQWGANTQWFIVTNGHGYLLSKNIADDGNLKLTQTTTNEATDDLLWCVVGDATNGYKFYNKAAGTEKVLGLTGSNENARATFVTEGTDNYTTAFEITRSGLTGATYWCMKQKGSDNNYWNRRGNYLAYWNSASATGNDQGSAYLFTPVNLEDIKDYTYQLTDNAGNTFEGTYKLIKGSKIINLPAFTGAAGYTVNNFAWNEDVYTATVTFPFPVSKVNGTTNWTFVRSQAMSDGIPYIYVNGEGKIVSKSTIAANGVYGYLPTNAEGEIKKWMWAIYPQFSDGNFTFQIKNAATNKYVPTATQQETSISVNETAGLYCWGTCVGANGFYLKDNTNLFWGAASSKANEQSSLIWAKPNSTSHKGCNLEFIDPIYVANCTLNDNSGNTYTGKAIFGYTVDESDVEKPQLTGVPTSLLANDNWENGTYTATLNLPFAVTNGEKVTPTFICAYESDVYKWHAVGTGIKTTKNVAATSADVATHLWEIIPQFNNGAFTFQIKNLATGTYIYSTSNTNTHDEGKVTLSATASDVTYESNGFKLSTGKLLSIGSSSGYTGAEQILGTWGSHNGTNLSFPDVKFNVEVGSTRFASLYTPVAGNFSGNVKTYAIKETSADYASLTELPGVEANQGAIIEATPGTYTFTAGEVSSDWTGNKLNGSSVNSYVAGSAYVLALVDGQAALALAALNKNANGEAGDSHFLNNAGKAYLPASAVTSNAQALRFNFGGTTGIEEAIVAPNENEAIYDLLGRRVMNAVKGGIYIKNGKKFIVK